MIHILEWAKSTNNQSIPLFSSQELEAIENPILFIGGVHGDEPEGVALAEHLLTFLKSNERSTPWALIPCLNPDGYNKKSRVNGNGVDLNRNFPSPDWSPTYEKDRYYPGSAPGSEPETRALTQLIINIQPRLIVHFHSWKPSIILTGPANLPAAELFSQTSGYPLELDIGYPTPGSLGQYAWFSKHIPVICIEEKEETRPLESWNRFRPAFENILNIKK